MGRYDLRMLRVHQQATQLLETPRLRREPPWFQVVQRVPPTQALVRTPPVQHRERPRRPRTKKASKMFHPQPIVYPEDELRRQFFADHPWELARPRLVLEDDGKDGQRHDGSRLQQPGQSVNGESVVQRQMWLLQQVPGMTVAQAYDQARHEFYEIRRQEEVERRVAQEEALATGAYFGKSFLEVGMELEDRTYEEWKQWALKSAADLQHAQGVIATGGMPDEEEAPVGVDETVADPA